MGKCHELFNVHWQNIVGEVTWIVYVHWQNLLLKIRFTRTMTKVHTKLRTSCSTVVARFAGLTVSQVCVTLTRCYGTRGAGLGLIASFRTVVTDGADCVRRVR